MRRRVAVTGLGAVTSLSCQVPDLWTRVCNGESGVHALTRFDCHDYRARIAGEIQNWSPSAYITPKEAKRLDLFAQYALVASIDAVNDSGLDFSTEEPFRCGVILGSGVGGLQEIEDQIIRMTERGPRKVSAFTIPKLMVNAASGHVSIQFGLRGPNSAVATACASATNAIGEAFKTIQYDDADVMITGGSEAAVTRMGISAFTAMRALSERNDEPHRASRPFDVGRDGFVLSEGAGALVFEELEHAKARGADIYAEVLGYGSSGDGGHITQPDADGVGAAKSMESALADARIDREQVAYINAHGTSTVLGDIAETAAVKSVFGDWAKQLSISSTKSQLGHLLGASGGVELVLTVKAVCEGIVPPTINLETPDPKCDLDYTPIQARPRHIPVAISNSFGFGGHNGSLIVGRLRDD